MSQENVDTVRRMFDAWKQGVREVPTDLVAPQIEFVSPLTSLRGRPYRGAARSVVAIQTPANTAINPKTIQPSIAIIIVSFCYLHLKNRIHFVRFSRVN